MKNKKFHFLASLACAAVLHSAETCITPVESKQIWIRHTEPKGVGYREGYTTLQAFLMHEEEAWGIYPYLDLRAHVFDNGRYGINAGAGGRYLGQNRVYGANAYYDARSTKRITFNQLSAGFETMGAFWDFFANGYLVIGRKNSSRYNPKFDRFENHFLYIQSSTDSGLSGADAKVRFHFLKETDWDAYLDLGGYYYHGSFGTNLGGGRTGVGAILYKYFFAEAAASYDNVFKWTGQGIFGFRMPLGRNIQARVRPCQDPILPTRLTQIPDHNEVIPIKKNRRLSKAIDPNTGDPFFFWFVNNLSHSLGTFESPFPFLVQAQNASTPRDIIYVFQGDGTAANQSEGIALKNYQQLLGSGISHDLYTTLGSISIPQLTPGYPVISNTLAMGSGVTLASNNTVSGLHIDSTQFFGIDGTGAANAVIKNNIISDSNLALGSDRAGINLIGPGMTGAYSIVGNQIYDTGPATKMIGAFLIPKGSDRCTITMVGNLISVPKDGVELKPEGSSSVNSAIAGNSFISTTAETAFFLEGHNSSQHLYTISNNTFQSGDAGLLVQSRDASSSEGYVSSNQFINCDKGFRFEIGSANTLLTATVNSNIFGNNGTYDFLGKIPGAHSPASICLSLSNNNAPQIGYEFENGGGLFNVYPFFNNTGPETTAGIITNNPGCP